MDSLLPDPEDPTGVDLFEVLGAEEANTALGRLRWWKRKDAETVELAEAIRKADRDRVDLWEATERKHPQARIEHYEQVLAQYHRARIAEDPKALTISLPNGTLKSRAQQPAVKVTDKAAFIAWAKENWAGLVRTTTTHTPDLDALKSIVAIPELEPGPAFAAFTADAEPIPGVTVEIREPRKYWTET